MLKTNKCYQVIINIIFLIIGLFSGIIMALIILRIDYAKNILKSINWSIITSAVLIFVGALIPILITYLTIKNQEINKLKAEYIKGNIDIIKNFRTLISYMNITVISDKTLNHMDIAYQPNREDNSSPTLRYLIILKSHEDFNNFNLKYQLLIKTLDELRDEKIDNYITYLSTYLLNLMIAIENVPDNYIWQFAVVLKDDFFNLTSKINELLDSYLDNNIFKLRTKTVNKISKLSDDEIKNMINKTNLRIYKEEFKKLESQSI